MAEIMIKYNSYHANLTGNQTFDTNSETDSNRTFIMEDKSFDTLCDDSAHNSSMCNKNGLGISLSTPILMLSFGVLGNMIALIVLYTAKNEMKRTVFYTFLCALAWTDLIGQLMTGPIAIIVYANNLQWVGGEPVCKYHAFVMIFFGITTPTLVCGMSMERVFALRFPYFHARAVTKKKARITILCCWLVVFLFCCVPLLGLGSYQHQFPGSWCFLNFHRESETDAAYAYMYSLINITIISIIIIANTVVMLTLLKMRKTRKINNSPSIDRRNGVKSKLKIEEETQMVWFLCAMTIVFSICVVPLNVHILINQITGRVDYAADLIGVRMASINQILDPWLYILLRKSVIVKTLKFIRNFFFHDKNNKSPKRSSRYVTNYSTNCNGHVNGVHSVKGNDVIQLKQYGTNTIIDVKEVNENTDGNKTESNESLNRVELDEVVSEKHCLTHGGSLSGIPGNRTEYKRSTSYGDHPNDNTSSSQSHPSLVNRKASLPARLTYGS